MLLQIFNVWLALLTIATTLMPILLILDWKKRGTVEGFCPVSLVLPMMVQSFSLRYSYLTDIQIFIIINIISFTFYHFFSHALTHFQPRRKTLVSLIFFVAIMATLVSSLVDQNSVITVMGIIATVAQIINLVGGVHEIKRAISLKTTEYVPGRINFALFALIVQWIIYAAYEGAHWSLWILTTTVLLVNFTTISLLFVYPPLTWSNF